MSWMSAWVTSDRTRWRRRPTEPQADTSPGFRYKWELRWGHPNQKTHMGKIEGKTVRGSKP